jgi:hypothetical protein
MKRTTLTSLVLFFLVLIVGVIVAPQIAPFWDEPDNIYAAGVYIRFFRSGFDRRILLNASPKSDFGDRIVTQDATLSHYPPVPNYVGAIIAVIGNRLGILQGSKGLIIAFHITAALFFALLVVMVYQWSILLGFSQLVGIFTALVTFLFPSLFGYGYSDLKDIAVASLITTSLYVLVKGAIVEKRRIIISGALLWGITVASKCNAIFVPFIWGIWLVISDKQHDFRRKFQTILTNFLPVAIIGILTAIAVWPYLWFDTLVHIKEIISYFATVGRGYHVFFAGRTYTAGIDRMWWYPWIHLLYITPPVLWILAIASFLRLNKRPTLPYHGMTLLIFWICLPLVRSFIPHAVFYDGIRHALEVIPPLILLAATGLTEILQWTKRKTAPSVIVVLALSVFLGFLSYTNIRLFPYSTGYLNFLSPNPNNTFDRDIGGISVKEALDYLHATYGPVNVWIPISAHQAWSYFLTNDCDMAGKPALADYIIIINKRSNSDRWQLEKDMNNRYSLIYTVSRGKNVFAWIYKTK